MNVTVIKSELYRRGGLEKYTWEIVRALCSKGAKVTLLTTKLDQPPFTDPHLEVISFPVDHLFSAWNVLHFDRLCRDYLKAHPTPIIFGLDRTRDQTHYRAGNGSHAAYLKRRKENEGALKGISFACNPLHRLLLAIEKEAFESPNLEILFTNSAMVKDEILSTYATDPQKIHVVHNGVEWKAMQAPFEAWQPQAGPHEFLFIGHNYQRKGLDTLLYALSHIRSEDFHLSVVGKDKRLPHFQKLAADLGLADKVHFYGEQKNIIPFYQRADTLVIPSWYDPFANVTVEALAMGVFVLSSRTNGGHEVLTQDTGAIIPSLHDREGFGKILRGAMEKKKTLESAAKIRQLTADLDFSKQMGQIIDQTLGIQSHRDGGR
ncbi:MAG: glycosyltransferase family 4 protein [Verrucomicrobia bacterium]|nr:glycosyltransferase family 4 protein [Verrucomicrobiota bacterium]